MIFEKLESEYSEKRKRLIERYEAEKSAVEENLKIKMEKKISEASREASIKKDQMVSKAKTEAHFEVLRKRDELLEKLIDELKVKVRNFPGTPGYLEFLKEAINRTTSRFPKVEKVYYTFTPEDLRKYEAEIKSLIASLKPEGEFEILSGDSAMLGGVIARSQSGRIEVDLSLETLLKENRAKLAQLLFSELGLEV
ncbi:MAG: V-type ATP synthase subunit E family protein [Bacillota bacterium]